MAPTRPSGTGKRGRPRKAAAVPAQKHQTITKQRRDRRRSAPTFQAPASASSAPKAGNASKRRKQSRVAVDNDDEDELAAQQPQPASEFTRLRPKTRRIAVQDIQEWPEMSSSVLEQVSVVLKHAKDKTALSRRDPKRREEADNVLGASVRRLERFLAKARMPPQAKAHQFDLNHLAAINERVFSELTEARHRSEDLEEQVRLANKRLQEELSRLEYVENNARDWRSRWKSRDNRQLHPLLRQSDSGADADDRPEDIGMRITEPTEPSLLETPDTELAPLLERLRRNLETMQGNQAQVDGISEATTRAQMALDDVLLRHGSAR